MKKGNRAASVRRLISFDRQSYGQLKQIALEEDRPFSWEVRRAIRAFLASKKGGMQKESLEEVKRKMLDIGVSKEVVELVGTVPMPKLKDEKSAIAKAVSEWMAEKGMS